MNNEGLRLSADTDDVCLQVTLTRSEADHLPNVLRAMKHFLNGIGYCYIEELVGISGLKEHSSADADVRPAPVDLASIVMDGLALFVAQQQEDDEDYDDEDEDPEFLVGDPGDEDDNSVAAIIASMPVPEFDPVDAYMERCDTAGIVWDEGDILVQPASSEDLSVGDIVEVLYDPEFAVEPGRVGIVSQVGHAISKDPNVVAVSFKGFEGHTGGTVIGKGSCWYLPANCLYPLD